ncbi:MAG: branched-chain amino acid transport system ATP-binding protein [Chloroflexota bacterium]|jgi:branched-chain amino acid transport system ATP-binding protein|nr:branched-chain amino acid transport system ATP-binding protein [Chloroflexota bacterium]
MTELRVQELTTGYHAPLEALTGVNLTVRSGQIVALVGPNGAGKTTLLSAISGLLRTWKGSIAIDGREISNRAPSAIVKAGIAQVPEGRGMLPGLTIAENLAMGAYTVDRATTKRSLERVYALFPLLVERAGQAAGTLSGGEQQMLAVGRALMSEPTVLLLDEPSMGLAPLFVERLFDHLTRLREDGLGILLVEQNAQLAFEVSEHAYVLERGRIVLDGPSAECAVDPRVVASYLGV